MSYEIATVHEPYLVRYNVPNNELRTDLVFFAILKIFVGAIRSCIVKFHFFSLSIRNGAAGISKLA